MEDLGLGTAKDPADFLNQILVIFLSALKIFQGYPKIVYPAFVYQYSVSRGIFYNLEMFVRIKTG